MDEKTNQVTNNCLATKFKSFYLRVKGRTKSLTSDLIQYLSPFTYRYVSRRMNQVTHKCFGQNLSPSTYGWKGIPSHHQVPWPKHKSFYLRVEGRTKYLMSALIKIKVFLPSSGRTNQATRKCLGTKFKSFYLRVKGRTKSLTGALVKV